jgi:phospholipid/cholesterol/gamma-HCH transport system permease protein
LSTYFRLNLSILYWLLVGPWREQSFKMAHVFQQTIRIGIEALPMASLTAFSIGLTLAMQGAHELSRMGADMYVPNLVSVSLLRELAPMLIAIIVIGRSGSAVTAELGTM